MRFETCKGAIMKLSAFLIREAACLCEDESVVLSATPEIVRKMALSAKHERDALYDAVRELFDVCDRLMVDSDLDDTEMRAMQKATRIIGASRRNHSRIIDPHEQ